MLLNQDPISDLSQYVGFVNGVLIKENRFEATTMPWYRGQDDFSWPLTPSIYRNDIGLYLREREMLRDFRLSADIIIKQNFSGITHQLEWIFLMQHYGLPTRLLDWTESSLIALYFAVRNYTNTQDSVVWIMDGWSLNSRPQTYNMFSIPDETSPIINSYVLPSTPIPSRSVEAFYPIAIRAKKSNARLMAQKGHFTIHGQLNTPLEDFVCSLNKWKGFDPVYLKQIKISGKHKLNILKELYVSGISDSVVFPEITGICSEIKFRHSSDFRDITNT